MVTTDSNNPTVPHQLNVAFFQNTVLGTFSMNALLINAFGLDSFKTAFAPYEDSNGPLPDNDQDKIDTWAL